MKPVLFFCKWVGVKNIMTLLHFGVTNLIHAKVPSVLATLLCTITFMPSVQMLTNHKRQIMSWTSQKFSGFTLRNDDFEYFTLFFPYSFVFLHILYTFLMPFLFLSSWTHKTQLVLLLCALIVQYERCRKYEMLLFSNLTMMEILEVDTTKTN